MAKLNEPQTSGRYRSVPHWLAHWKPTVIVAVAADGSEHRIAITATQRKWHIAWRAIEDVRATSVRALDADGNILSTTEIARDDDEPNDETEAEDAVQLAPVPPAATAAGIDVSAIVSTTTKVVADAVVTAMREATQAQAQTFRSTLEENNKLVGMVVDRLTSVEQMLHERLVAEVEAADERQQAQESSENAQVMQALITAVGPELGKVFIGGLVKQATAAATNGAPTLPAPAPKDGDAS